MFGMKQVLLTTIVCFTQSVALFAGDWPMWRCDAERSAASPDGIATNLTLRWSRKLPPPQPAWPLEFEQRLNFDASYEPVVMGKTLFLASQNDGGVTAYDTETGAEKWKFYTEGPVRCAPACWKNRLYVGSDDGYLYCLDAATGTLAWRFRGAPKERPDRRQLGNGHLVSFWPVRGGPVIRDGVVYCGAGIWPTFGVFLYALDAETGAVKWQNGELNYLSHVRGDHDQFYDQSGLSPQGHFAIAGDRLVVPCGRAFPAGLDLATGKLITYLQGSNRGDSRVAVHGQQAFVGRNAILSLYDFRDVTSPWAGQGGNKPEGYKTNFQDTPENLWEAPMYSYKSCEGVEAIPGDVRSPAYTGCDAYSAFADGIAYSLSQGAFYAHSVSRARVEKRTVMYGGQKPEVRTWTIPLVWKYKSPYDGPPGGIVIKVGQRLYGSANKKLIALEDLSTQQPRVAWERDFEGHPSSLIAADNKLFVATTEGGFYCFGQTDATGGAKIFDDQAVPFGTKTNVWTGKAQEIVKATGVTAGYGLVLGLQDGALIEGLLKQTDLLVLGVDADAQKIDRLRQRFAAAGALGSRVELFVGQPFEFGFPPYLASLIVSEKPAAFPEQTAAARLFSILRPYGGTLCLALPPESQPKFADWAKGVKAANADVKRAGNWSLLIRTGAPPGSAPWTHEGADAANTFCSQDDLVQAPLGYLWYGDQCGFATLKYHGAQITVKPKVAGGRVVARDLFNRLFAYDAYTGRFLWNNQVNCVNNTMRYVACPDTVYVVADNQCYRYDAATGKPQPPFTFNATNATTAKDLRVAGDVILVAFTGEPLSKGFNWDEYFSGPYYEGKTLVGLDRQSGAQLWRREAQQRFKIRGLALTTGVVFCVDSLSPPLPGQTNLPPEAASTILALDARTGREIWSRSVMYPAAALQNPNEWLAYSAQTGMVVSGRGQLVSAFDAKTGRVLWDKRMLSGWPPMIVHDASLIDQNGGMWSISTGDRIGALDLSGGGCNYRVGGRHLIMGMNRSAWYFDIEQRQGYFLRTIRSGCANSWLAADGLLNVPCFSLGCVCNFAVQTSYALVSMPEVADWAGSVPVAVVPPPAK
jgi:outer membrane protein assembly factor BamB